MLSTSIFFLFPLCFQKFSAFGCICSIHLEEIDRKMVFYLDLNSLPKDKFLDWSKLKAFSDDILKFAEKLKFVLGRVENIVGKGENACKQHFLLFSPCFQNTSFQGH